MLCRLLFIRLNVSIVSRIVMFGKVIIYQVFCVNCNMLESMVFYFGVGGCVFMLRNFSVVMLRMVLEKFSDV